MKRPDSIRPPDGKLGILLPGMGAVSSTFIAGVLLARRGLGVPVGSLTQLGGLRVDGKRVRMNELLPLAGLEQLVSGGWDIFPDSIYEAALHARVLESEQLEPVRDVAPDTVHASRRAFEAGLQKNDPAITNSQLYAWACVQEGVAFANGSPNLAVDFPAAAELARSHEVALAGMDFKTGQTLMKTVIAPALKARMLGVNGWFSTNILGNRDGEVLDVALLLDLAQRGGRIGPQDWLGFYFKSPMTAPGRPPEHDLFVQCMKLKNTLRSLMGHEPGCPPGTESYD